MSKSPGKQIILKLTRDELLEKCQRDTNWVGEKKQRRVWNRKMVVEVLTM